MGLSGRKAKQKIPNDPRNLTWADDAARFGSSYLSKFGWDASKGLGVSGDGRTSHIKVSQKLDMMGIGAAHMKDPNGIAWKQNRDFENLLKRLNENVAEAKEVKVTDEVVVETKSSGKEKKKKSEKDKKRKYEEEQPEQKKRRKSGDNVVIEPEVSTSVITTRPPPRHRAHRARAIAAKNISSKSSAHIDEILGIAPTLSLSQSASGSATPAEGKLTVVPELEKTTTSTKSVADYFKDKLSSKSSKSTSPAISADSPGLRSRDVDYEDEKPAGGLGFSRLQLEQESRVEEGSTRMGFSKFSSLVSSTFLSAKSLYLDSKPDIPFAKEETVSSKDETETSCKDESREQRKRRRKAEKEAKKAQAERKRERGEFKKKKKSRHRSKE